MAHRFLTRYVVDYATDLTVAVVERCMESSSPSDTKPKISKEERDALKLLIQNVGRIYPPRRFVALLVATLIYIERIEGRTRMKEGVNMTCSVFVGGVILASRVGHTYSSRFTFSGAGSPTFRRSCKIKSSRIRLGVNARTSRPKKP